MGKTNQMHTPRLGEPPGTFPWGLGWGVKVHERTREIQLLSRLPEQKARLVSLCPKMTRQLIPISTHKHCPPFSGRHAFETKAKNPPTALHHRGEFKEKQLLLRS